MSDELTGSDWYRLTLRDDTDMLSAWQDIDAMDNVVTVQPNYIYTAQTTTESIMDADPYIHAQTWLDRINAVDAWENGANIGGGIVVAVADSGVDMDHPDLAGKLLSGYDFVDNDNDPDDENGHGTHVAGIIAACNNDLGVRGVACGARILAVRVLDENGGGNSETTAEGIKFAADHGAKIINLSLGGFGRDTMQEDAIRYARAQGCLVVAAAGNENLPTALAEGETYGGVYCRPANCPGVLTVMAADEDGALASFSNYDTDPDEGAEYEIMAPGVNILSTTYDGSYGYMDGTSMACPVVAGAAAVLMGMGCDADSAFQIIASCAKVDAGRVDYRYPTLDLKACVDKAKTNRFYNTAPCITELSMSAPVQGIQFTGRKPVTFQKLGTDGVLFFLNGELLSVPTLYFENIGGSGDVTICGSVGGVAVNEARTVQLGECAEIELSLSGTPQIENGAVAVDLQVGEERYQADWDAYRLKFIADELGFTTSGAETTMTAQSLTLHGAADAGTVWVLDTELTIPVGHELTFMRKSGERELTVYQAADAEISCITVFGSNSYGTVNCYDAMLMGDRRFTVYNDSGNNIEYCTVCDPWITWVGNCINCRIIGSREGQDVEKRLHGYSFELCGFYNCTKLDLSGRFFWANMITCCANSTMTVGNRAESNTFIENFDMDDAQSVLKVKTVNMEPNTDGWFAFRHNSVVGPLLLRNPYDNGYALCERTYHQPVPAEILPEGVSDEIACAPGSEVGETLEDYWRFGCGNFCPLFALKLFNRYEYIAEGQIDYYHEVQCSADISDGSVPMYTSFTDMFADSAYVWKDMDYPNWCNASGSTQFENDEMQHFYLLENVYRADVTEELNDGSAKTYDYSTTALFGQTLKAEFEFYSTALDSMSGTRTEDGYVLQWADEELAAGDTAKISASVNDGEETLLGTVDDAYTTRSFTDTTKYDADTSVCYTVEIYRNDRLYKSGTTTYLLSLPDSEQGIDLSVGAFSAENANTLSAAAEGKVLIDGSLVFTFPGLRATAVTFGEEVENAGIIYGAASDETGTTVYLGCDDSAILAGGETLFTLNAVAADDGEKTVTVTNRGVTQSWGKMDCVTYASVAGVRTAQDGNDGALQLWNSGSGNCFLARYDGSGKLLSVTEPLGALSPETPESGKMTIFFIGDGYVPQREPITITAQE